MFDILWITTIQSNILESTEDTADLTKPRSCSRVSMSTTSKQSPRSSHSSHQQQPELNLQTAERSGSFGKALDWTEELLVRDSPIKSLCCCIL